MLDYLANGFLHLDTNFLVQPWTHAMDTTHVCESDALHLPTGQEYSIHVKQIQYEILKCPT